MDRYLSFPCVSGCPLQCGKVAEVGSLELLQWDWTPWADLVLTLLPWGWLQSPSLPQCPHLGCSDVGTLEQLPERFCNLLGLPKGFCNLPAHGVTPGGKNGQGFKVGVVLQV